MTGVHRMYFYMMSNVVSQIYGQVWSAAELENLRREVCAIEQMVVNMFSPVCTSVIFTQKCHLLERVIEDVSRFGCLSALNRLPCE